MDKKVKDTTFYCTADMAFTMNGESSEEEILEEIKNRIIKDAGADDVVIRKMIFWRGERHDTEFEKAEVTKINAKTSHTEDNVDHPSHYTNGKVECIDALEAATTGLEGIEAVCTANAIKYLWR